MSNIKDTAKELMGKSLNSLHKDLGSRINKLNEENKFQDKLLNTILTQVDDNYIEKTEESSVMFLEGSKDGAVEVESIEGNTLVNYCRDGSKELVLNGEIDLEGNSVTTTESVEGGKVDVMCEGNTLVNCVEENTLLDRNNFSSLSSTATLVDGYINIIKNGTTGYSNFFIKKNKYVVKPNTLYTYILDISENNTTSSLDNNNIVIFGNSHLTTQPTFWTNNYLITTNDKGIIKFTMMTKSDFTEVEVADRGFMLAETSGNIKFRWMILEGDWTNVDFTPDYFEGMKSVGELENNRISLTSATGKPNLIRNSGFLNNDSEFIINGISNGTTNEIIDDASAISGKIAKITAPKTGNGIYQRYVVNSVENVQYTLSGWCKGSINKSIRINIEKYKNTIVSFDTEDWTRFEITTEKNPIAWNGVITFYNNISTENVFYLKDLKLEVSDTATPYIPNVGESNYNSFINTKQIQLSEPLRGLPNGVKDRFVKKEGKWYIERNTIQYDINSSSEMRSESFVMQEGLGIKDESKNNNSFSIKLHNAKDHKSSTNIVNNVYNLSISNTYYGKQPSCYVQTRSLRIYDDRINGIDEFKTYLDSLNPKFSVVYELETPTYEPIEDIELLTYLDTTHISNNSSIPCNMKVKNTGYNVIAKPNTTYTVLSNTSSPKVDLCGTTKALSGYVDTVTTGATLTDDSLRISNKGAISNKVMLIEGDLTNKELPSYFEGIESSFEDCVGEDGKYEVEILSNNRNLLDNNKLSQGVYNYGDVGQEPLLLPLQVRLTLSPNKAIPIKPNTIITTYSEKFEFAIAELNNGLTNGDTGWRSGKRTITTKSNTTHIAFNIRKPDSSNITMENVNNGDIVVYYGANDYRNLANEQNSLKFQLNSPLLYGDKLVVKDGKLCHYHRAGKTDFSKIMVTETSFENIYRWYVTPEPKNKLSGFCMSDALPTITASDTWGHIGYKDGIATNSNGTGNIVFYMEEFNDGIQRKNEIVEKFKNNNIIYELAEPFYEEVQDEYGEAILLEGYEDGTIYIDSNITPTTTVRYTPKIESVQALSYIEETNNNLSTDVNDSIIPYMMDVDMMLTEKEMALAEQSVEALSINNFRIMEVSDMTSMQERTQQMLERLFRGKTLEKEECQIRVTTYLNAKRITDAQAEELMLLIEDIYE